tara:strand:+ start:894 stop:1607 length:714 start_codon:yes stop_codon:yes gene_type:complete
MNKTIGFIFARGGSKKLIRKNIKPLNGLPLIAYSIKLALEINEIDEVIVSTDDQEIADISIKFGAKVPSLRPKELAQDTTPEWDCWKHAVLEYNKLNNQGFNTFISLPCTSPLRMKGDIIQMLKYYELNDFDLVLGVTPSSRSPYFNMVRTKDDGSLEKIINTQENVTRRQDSPKCFDITTIGYITSPEYILDNNNIFDGRIGGYEISKESSIDIDDEIDFKIAEFLQVSDKNDKKV